MQGDRLKALSEREKECLILVFEDKSSKQIAQILGIKHKTVDNYLASAMSKLGVESRHAAARMLAQASARTTNAILPEEPGSLVIPSELEWQSPPKRMDRPWFEFPVLRFGRRFATLPPRARLGWLPILTIGLLAAGAFIANLYGALYYLLEVRK